MTGPCSASGDRSLDPRGRTSSVDRPPASRVTLLDGFHLEVTGRDRRSTADLPRGVQRLVAHPGLAHGPTRTATARHPGPDGPGGHAHGSLPAALRRLKQGGPRPIWGAGGAPRGAAAGGTPVPGPRADPDRDGRPPVA